MLITKFHVHIPQSFSGNVPKVYITYEVHTKDRHISSTAFICKTIFFNNEPLYFFNKLCMYNTLHYNVYSISCFLCHCLINKCEKCILLCLYFYLFIGEMSEQFWGVNGSKKSRTYNITFPITGNVCFDDMEWRLRTAKSFNLPISPRSKNWQWKLMTWLFVL